jgi:hypothetical protein
MGGDLVGIGQRRQVDHPDAIAVIRRDLVCDRERDRRLADSARTREGDEALERQPPGSGPHDVVATENRFERGRPAAGGRI